MHEYLQPLCALYEAHQNPEYAPAQKSYMREQFEFYGIRSAQRQSLEKDFLKSYGLPKTVADLEAIITSAWAQPQRDYQYFAVELMIRSKKIWTTETITFMEKILLQKSWWDTIDPISVHWVGAFFLKFPQEKYTLTERWNMSENFWLQRVSIIFQLQYKAKTDFDLLCNYILSRADSTEFFVQKAIGWSLREYAKKNPKKVLDFVENTELKPLSRKEALKHF